jgi:Peptidase family M28
MKKFIIICFIIILSGCSASKSIVDEKSDNFLIEKYKNSITSDALKSHLTIIASDEMEGRDTGSKGQKKAGLYLINHYKNNNITFPEGAENYFQKVPASFMNKYENEKLPDSENILAFIKGSVKPDEVLVISAHYDHIGKQKGVIYNGADDDGSGTVALLEIAKAFKLAQNEGHSPKRSILFIHMTGEEHGLYGSSYYSENPVFPLNNTITDINIDMIGRRDNFHKNSNNYIYIIGSNFLSTDLYNITEEVNKKYINLDLDYKYNDKNDPERFYYRSDHYNFAKNGIPSVFLFNGTHADYHKPSDKIEKIEFDALTKRTQLAFVMAWELANRDKRPVVDKK